MRTLFAVTAPVEAVDPDATTQSPTANAPAVVVFVSLALVDELIDTAIVELACVVDVVELEPKPPKPADVVPSIEIESDETEITFPEANTKSPFREPDGAPPEGALPDGKLGLVLDAFEPPPPPPLTPPGR